MLRNSTFSLDSSYRAGIVAAGALMLFTPVASAAEGEGGVTHWGKVFLMLAVVLMAGKIGEIVERFGQPSVIGELLAGILLAVAGYMGIGFIDDIVAEPTVAFLAQLGALLLLFSIGLESNIAEMKAVGLNALLVAIIGVAVPFVLGTWVLGPFFFEDDSFNAHLFLGAAMVATSVGITASVFMSLGLLKSRAAQTVLGAAVIDDVIGLIVLAVVSALASGKEVGAGMVLEMVGKSFLFLALAIVLGKLLAPIISSTFSRISQGTGMKLSIALSLALSFGYVAEVFGLEPIIGAFAAGLILDAVTFKHYADPDIVRDIAAVRFDSSADSTAVAAILDKHRHSGLEELFRTLNYVFVPVFFVFTGMQVDIASLLKPELYLIAVVIGLAAILSKVVAGIAAKGSMLEKLMVGASMVPRGEVGLIFAATGKATGVLSQDLFSVIILVVMLTTFVSPPVIGRLGKMLSEEHAEAGTPAA